MNSYDEELRALSLSAESGNSEAGNRLLKLFSELASDGTNAHPELVEHVARCIGRIINDDSDPREALCIKRPAQRPKDTGAIAARNDAGLHKYCAARARGETHERAIILSCTVQGLTESAMKAIYESTGPFKRNLLIELYRRSPEF